MQLYISDHNKTTNQLIKNKSLVDNGGWAIAAFEKDRITHTRPDTPYYYYVYCDNAVIQQLDIMGSSGASEQLYVPTEVANDVRTGRCKIILDHSLEGFPVRYFNEINFQKFLGEFVDDTIYLSGDYKSSTKKIVNTQYSNYWELIVSTDIARRSTQQYNDSKLNITLPTKFKAICKNRLTRPVRIEIVPRINELKLQHDITSF